MLYYPNIHVNTIIKYFGLLSHCNSTTVVYKFDKVRNNIGNITTIYFLIVTIK